MAREKAQETDEHRIRARQKQLSSVTTHWDMHDTLILFRRTDVVLINNGILARLTHIRSAAREAMMARFANGGASFTHMTLLKNLAKRSCPRMLDETNPQMTIVVFYPSTS